MCALTKMVGAEAAGGVDGVGLAASENQPSPLGPKEAVPSLFRLLWRGGG